MQFKTIVSANNIVYLDLNKIMSTSISGFSLIQQLNQIDQQNVKVLNKNLKQLKDQDVKLLSQKNILSELEFKNKINKLRKEVELHKKNKQKTINDLNKIRIKHTNDLLKSINEVLSEYSTKNSISIILKKKDIVIGKTDLDITDQILNLVNNKIKEVKIK
tara:strand:+ start:2213 stop:2695 length:483 start_codon:yes stop_codon:yes gene_type:complete